MKRFSGIIFSVIVVFSLTISAFARDITLGASNSSPPIIVHRVGINKSVVSPGETFEISATITGTAGKIDRVLASFRRRFIASPPQPIINFFVDMHLNKGDEYIGSYTIPTSQIPDTFYLNYLRVWDSAGNEICLWEYIDTDILPPDPLPNYLRLHIVPPLISPNNGSGEVLSEPSEAKRDYSETRKSKDTAQKENRRNFAELSKAKARLLAKQTVRY